MTTSDVRGRLLQGALLFGTFELFAVLGHLDGPRTLLHAAGGAIVLVAVRFMKSPRARVLQGGALGGLMADIALHHSLLAPASRGAGHVALWTCLAAFYALLLALVAWYDREVTRAQAHAREALRTAVPHHGSTSAASDSASPSPRRGSAP